MFPGQQGATCPAQIWPPRLGIKLLEGAASTEKWLQGVYFRMASREIGAISLVFAQSVERAKVVVSTLPPLYGVSTMGTECDTINDIARERARARAYTHISARQKRTTIVRNTRRQIKPQT